MPLSFQQPFTLPLFQTYLVSQVQAGRIYGVCGANQAAAPVLAQHQRRRRQRRQRQRTLCQPGGAGSFAAARRSQPRACHADGGGGAAAGAAAALAAAHAGAGRRPAACCGPGAAHADSRSFGRPCSGGTVPGGAAGDGDFGEGAAGAGAQRGGGHVPGPAQGGCVGGWVHCWHAIDQPWKTNSACSPCLVSGHRCTTTACSGGPAHT